MASTINASTISTSGLVYNADASGVLQLQSNGVTGLTIGAGGVVTAANGIVMNTMTLGSPVTGEFEYDGTAPYFTPMGTQRGVVPGMQYYVTGAAIAGSNTTSTQNILGVGVTLSNTTCYAFEGCFNFFKTAGTTSHRFRFGWGGTSTLARIVTNVLVQDSEWGYFGIPTTVNARLVNYYSHESAAHQELTQNITSAFRTVNIQVKGIVRVTTGGTLIPQYSLSAAPGGAYTASVSNYMSIWPIGFSDSNATVSVGTWA